MAEMPGWWIYKGTNVPDKDIITRLPEPPNWRNFGGFNGERLRVPEDEDERETERHIGKRFEVSDAEKELINAALYLRRPLLITGKPGLGKSSLAYAVAHELKLGRVLKWPITTYSSLENGLYRYDPIARLEDARWNRHTQAGPEGKGSSSDGASRYLRLGPLGTALLPWERPRVLLIDEIDKSDINLPNDLLNIFEAGEFDIPILMRLSEEDRANTQGVVDNHNQNANGNVIVRVMPYNGKKDSDKVPVSNGHVQCAAFPFVVMTSNEEREFPPAFLRRCLRLDIGDPDSDKLAKIVEAHLGTEMARDPRTKQLIDKFIKQQKSGEVVATDQLLNAIYMIGLDRGVSIDGENRLSKALFQKLTKK